MPIGTIVFACRATAGRSSRYSGVAKWTRLDKIATGATIELWEREPMIAGTRRTMALAIALLAVAVTPASAQSDAAYPNKVIRIVVGFAAGGGNDIFARLVGAKLSELIGQSVII